MASQLAGIRRGIGVVAVSFLLHVGGAAQVPEAAAKTPSLKGDARAASEHLGFAREFSSAQDVKRAHPILDLTLDIIAGRKTVEDPLEVLQTPYAVTTDSGHRVFVTDVGAGRVHVFDFRRSKYSFLQNGSDQLRRPLGVATDHEGNVYVTDSGLGAILVYDSRGKFRHFLKESKGRESYFEGPWGIAIDPATERIYVCDSPRHMVIVLDKKGHVLNRFGKRGGGTRAGEFNFPTQIVAAGDEIVVLDSGNRRLQVLDVRGHFRREINVPDVDSRSGLAMDEDGRIYVSNEVVNRVQAFNHDGRLLYAFGQMGTKAGEFDGASGLWVDSGHCLYVVDTRNKRVQAFHVDGKDTNGCQ